MLILCGKPRGGSNPPPRVNTHDAAFKRHRDSAMMGVAGSEILPSVACEGVSKSFGHIEALWQVSLGVPSGVTFGLIGPNGAGKTTLIRVLLGLTRPDAGMATVLGHPIPPHQVLTRIGYMPQEVAIYPDLTVEENLALFGYLSGMERPAIDRRTDEVLRLVDLPERRRDLASKLSGGMKRRVSLAAALLHDPDLLLLDEPTVGIDPELRDSFWSFFHDLAAQGKTVLITTHYMDEASRCRLVGLIHEGRMLGVDSPGAIAARTQTTSLEDAFLSLVRGGERGR